MPQELASHLQNLLVSRDKETSESTKQAWADILASWDADVADVVKASPEDEGDRPPYEPLPTLLDFYKPGPQALAFPRLDDELHERHRDESHTRNGEPTALTVASNAPAPSPSGVEAALAQRIKRCVKLYSVARCMLILFIVSSLVREPIILKSLQELLASPADADEIQFEVLQILGLQGDAFDIAAQILDPEKRSTVVELLKPQSRNRRAAARGLNADGTLALPTSQAEADAMIEAQLAAAENRPLWTGEKKVRPYHLALGWR